MSRQPSHEWTKNEVKEVAKLWETSTSKELSEKLGVKEFQLQYIVGQMKKAGFTLTKKHKNGNMQNLLKEALSEMQ